MQNLRRSSSQRELFESVVEGSEGQMKPQRKHRPNWDDASYLMRTDPEREKKPRIEAGKLPEVPFSFDWPAIKKAWEAIGVTWLKEGDVRVHVVDLATWKRRWKK